MHAQFVVDTAILVHKYKVIILTGHFFFIMYLFIYLFERYILIKLVWSIRPITSYIVCTLRV